ncbi:DUF596 domain-containing protein [Cupriavidus basilensis]|uniref:DUF596 domain-containing protein n=1 Tax=Cupriavidus basilensis TaxID=68895 RepID=UPI0009E33E25|nr:DUF596 domain-containing protein [Cupriavidus basilensis]
MLSNAQYEFIAEGCEDMELDSIWDYFSSPFGSKFLPHRLQSFEERRDGFLWVLNRLLYEKRIILVDLTTHASLLGSAEAQVYLFRKAFPSNDAEMDGGLWFFSPACPGGASWQR